MIVYIAAVGTLACLASIGRLWIAWKDYRRRWPKPSTRAPTASTVRLPAGGWINR